VRLKRVPFSAGVRYYVRLLARHVPARSYADLRRFPTGGVEHETFELACRKRGLLADADEGREVVERAILAAAGDPGLASQLRSLFAHFVHEGFPMVELLDDPAARTALAADMSGTPAEAWRAALDDLDDRLVLLGSDLHRHAPDHYADQSNDSQAEVRRERRAYDRDAQRALADSSGYALDTLDYGEDEQSAVVQWGLCGRLAPDEPRAGPHQLAHLQERPPTSVEVGVLQADGGAGKTRSVKRLSAELRARGLVVLATASTNLAATNYERGMSTHALALLAGDGEDGDGNVTIKLRPEGRMTIARRALLREASLIVIDEFSSLHRSVIEARALPSSRPAPRARAHATPRPRPRPLCRRRSSTSCGAAAARCACFSWATCSRSRRWW
jgi:hypothetical protein